MLRQTFRCTAGVLGLGLLLACSKPAPTDADAAAADSAPAPAARPATVLDGQLRALDKARGVEQQLEKEKADHDKAIEDAGG